LGMQKCRSFGVCVCFTAVKRKISMLNVPLYLCSRAYVFEIVSNFKFFPSLLLLLLL
jgi:hypothetical protein